MQKWKKYLLCSVVLEVLVSIGCVYYFIFLPNGNECLPDENCGPNFSKQEARVSECISVCSTKECVLTSDFIQSNIDDSIDPCDDFYSFSCGKWMAKFDENENHTLFYDVEENLKRTMKDVLDSTNGVPGSASDKLKIVYDSCMEEDSSEAEALPTILNFLHEIGISDWPHLPPNFEFVSGLNKVLGILLSYNEFAFVRVDPKSVEDSSTAGAENLLVVKLQYPLMVQDTVLEEYEKIVTGILGYFNFESELINTTWQEFRTIDEEVQKLYLENDSRNPDDDASDIVDKFMECSVDANLTTVTVCEIIKHALENVDVATESQHGFFVAYSSDYYVNHIFLSLQKFSQRSIANYLALRCFITHLGDLNFFFRKMASNIPEIEHMPTALVETVHWKRCVQWINHYMHHALSFQYIPKKLSKDIEEVRGIVHDIFEIAAATTDSQEWIEDDDRKNILSTIQKLTSSLDSAVDSFQNESRINNLYDKFIPTRKSFLRNILEFRKRLFAILSLSSKFSEDLEISSPFVVNAYHLSGMIDLKFGMLRLPFYLHGRPKLLNYAILGSSIGHEIGHELLELFGDKALNNITKLNFMEKQQCFEKQYSQFEVKKIQKKVKGNVTYVEDLPDFIGAKLMQKAVDKYMTTHNESFEFYLPALNYSERQLVFILSAQMWCAVRSKEEEEKHYEKDTHTPPNFRVIGIMQNSKEFSEAFGCSFGKLMNPSDKCSFYD